MFVYCMIVDRKRGSCRDVQDRCITGKGVASLMQVSDTLLGLGDAIDS